MRQGCGGEQEETACREGERGRAWVRGLGRGRMVVVLRKGVGGVDAQRNLQNVQPCSCVKAEGVAHACACWRRWRADVSA